MLNFITKTTKQRQCRRSGVFVVNFEQVNAVWGSFTIIDSLKYASEFTFFHDIRQKTRSHFRYFDPPLFAKLLVAFYGQHNTFRATCRHLNQYYIAVLQNFRTLFLRLY